MNLLSLRFILTIAFAFIPLATQAKNFTLGDILALSAAPPGVVIEIVTPEEEGLRWALPLAQLAVTRLREKFKDLPIAVVTHGTEQFALTQKQQSSHKAEHQIVQSLMSDSQVAVHVCGTHAEWKGVHPEDFPAYVDVAAAGPAQINDYKALGYLPLVIKDN